MCNSACEEKLNGKMDVILEKLEPVVNTIHDHENRLRTVEHFNCPKHEELNKKVDKVIIAQAVNNVKLAIIIGISGSLGSLITITISGVVTKMIM